MRPAAVIAVVVLASFAGAQTPTNQNQKPAQPATAGTPLAKHLPQAKTQPEFDAYKAAVANQSDPATMEKATDDFAAKFPNSELTPLLYRAAMRGYQNANNGDKLAEIAQKVLKSDPDDPEALTDLAEVIAERTHDTDLDKDQRYEEARKDATHALQTVDTDLPPGVAPEQAEAYKGLLKSTAYSIVGTVDFNQEKFADAESNFRKSIDAFPSQPDPVVVLRLALALDKQDKYPEALKAANQAVELTQDTTSPGKLARQERDRLVQLTGGAATAGAKAPAATAPTSTPPGNPQPH